MTRFVKGFFGFGFGVERHRVCDDKDISISWLNWNVKLMLGPWVVNWNIGGRKEKR